MNTLILHPKLTVTTLSPSQFFKQSGLLRWRESCYCCYIERESCCCILALCAVVSASLLCCCYNWGSMVVAVLREKGAAGVSALSGGGGASLLWSTGDDAAATSIWVNFAASILFRWLLIDFLFMCFVHMIVNRFFLFYSLFVVISFLVGINSGSMSPNYFECMICEGPAYNYFGQVCQLQALWRVR